MIFAVHVSYGRVASLAVLPVLIASWLVSGRLALSVAVPAIALQLVAFQIADERILPVAARVLTVAITFLLADGVARRLARGEIAAPSPALARTARAQLRLARLFAWKRGDLRSARRLGRDAHGLFQRAGRPDRAQLALNDLGWISGLGGDVTSQEATARKVLEMPDPKGVPVVLAALTSLQWACLMQGKFQAAEEALQRILQLVPDHERKNALARGALCLAIQGQLRDAQSMLTVADRDRDRQGFSDLTGARIIVGWLRGRYEAVIEDVGLWESKSPNPRTDWARPFVAVCACELGRVDIARRLLSSSADYSEGPFPVLRDLFGWSRGVVAWRDNRLDEASDLLWNASSGLLELGVLPLAAFVLFDLAEVALRAARPASSVKASLALGRIAERVGRPLYTALADLGWARSQLGTARDPDLGEVARVAVETLRTIGCEGLAARGLDVLGSHLSLYSRREGVEAFNTAMMLHAESGASWRQQRSAEALRRLGHAGRRAAAGHAGPNSLTRRELEVVRLAAAGLTGRQIGAKLFITERTVETHLANAYAKLGMRSKQELINRASELSGLSGRYGFPA